MKHITSNKQQCNPKEKCKKMPASIYSCPLYAIGVWDFRKKYDN